MKWRLAEHVSFTEADRGGVLLNEARGTYWQVNVTGAQVLRSLLNGNDVPQTIQHLSAAYPDQAAQITGDVHGLIEAATKAELIQHEP
ncbi:lasso peptide biosynthesis PqqD family chaperone [Leucobacter sp. NPDC015123]|uniref:lasso peptide biosynthesis PqqD family chaperone n=1 Tax=Leucobacter sp. NPDC015123 TaxID=3364129 RepID=UPI0036F46ECC